jgi:hypothetical protein
MEPMPMDNDANRCTATAKSTGERCKNSAVEGWDVCRFHGAGSPKNETTGGAPVKHGRYSAKRKESLQEKIEAYREEDDPAEMWSEISLLRALLQEWLDDLETLDEDTVSVILRLQDSIRKTLDSINRIKTRTALTASEIELVQARIADLFKSYVPEDRRDDALNELKQITEPNGPRTS